MENVKNAKDFFLQVARVYARVVSLYDYPVPTLGKGRKDPSTYSSISSSGLTCFTKHGPLSYVFLPWKNENLTFNRRGDQGKIALMKAILIAP